MSFCVSNYSKLEGSCIENGKGYLAARKSKESSEKEKFSKEFQRELFLIITFPFKSCSDDFYKFLKNNTDIQSIYIDDRFDYVKPFFLIESYLRDKTIDNSEKLKSYLCKVKRQDFKQTGTGLLRPVLADGVIVRNVYRSGDEALIELFKTYLPKPNIELFQQDGGPIPESIAKQAKQVEDTIERLVQKNGKESLEKSVITIQRWVRGFQRQKKELFRVMEIEDCDENEAKERILAGDTPYMPKCKNPELAERIFQAALKVPDYPTISHVTAAWALPKILDGCLYGRQFLAARYLPYRPAQLWLSDQNNGDANAICFGPQEIDSRAWKPESVQIILDMKKFKEKKRERQNPCIFFKQQDLGYPNSHSRLVMISGNAWISFNHTQVLQVRTPRYTGFTLNFYAAKKYAEASSQRYAQVPFQTLMSSNFKQMTAIQTLNFFRYLDALTDANFMKASNTIDEIYDEIAQLNEEELKNFLGQLHEAITDTAEFNFYGAYKIDLSLIKEILIAPKGLDQEGRFSICISELIESLNRGDLDLYKAAKKAIPFLFESERFMNFLRSHLKNPEILEG